MDDIIYLVIEDDLEAMTLRAFRNREDAMRHFGERANLLFDTYGGDGSISEFFAEGFDPDGYASDGLTTIRVEELELE